MSSKRKLRSAGVTTDQTLDATKNYKLNTSGTLVEATTVGETDIVFTGSKSSLRRISDLERNVSILAAKAFTDDGSASGELGTIDYAKTAGKWYAARTLSLTGDVTGSASIDGSGNVSLSTTIGANTVALGTDTTGNYVASLVAGTGITLSNNSGESATPTVAVDTSTIATQSWVTTQIATKDNTDEITEGTTNLYFTNARARGAVSFTAGSGAYNSSTGVITIPTNTNQLTNGASFITLSSLSAGTGISYNSGTGAISSTITQYTDALARAAHSFTAGSGAYNSSTGVITIPTNTNQLTNGAGFITGYTETDTLSSVTGRGASTGTAISITSATASTTTSTGALIVSGGVGIGGKLNVGGGAAVTGALTATGEITAYFSDLRLKTNIVPVTDALEKVEAINGVTFDPNETALGLGVSPGKQMGVIAQEIEAVAPELVTNSAFEGYKTVKYDKLTALLIEAVKELSAKVKTLEAQLGNTKPTL